MRTHQAKEHCQGMGTKRVDTEAGNTETVNTGRVPGLIEASRPPTVLNSSIYNTMLAANMLSCDAWDICNPCK